MRSAYGGYSENLGHGGTNIEHVARSQRNCFEMDQCGAQAPQVSPGPYLPLTEGYRPRLQADSPIGGRTRSASYGADEIVFMVNESFRRECDSLLGKRAGEEVPSVRTSSVELDLQLVNPGRIMDFLRSMISRILKNFEHIGLDFLGRPYFSFRQTTSPRDSTGKSLANRDALR